MGVEISLQVIQTCAGIVGVVGNTLVCVVINRVKPMHTLTNSLIFNQAVIDLLGSLLTLVTANVGVPHPLSGWSGELYCRVWESKFFIWAFFASSTFSLTALTLERYFAIVFPFLYKRWFSKTMVALIITAVWVLGCVSSIYNLTYIVFDGHDSCVSVTHENSTVVGTMLFLFEYAIPLGVMLYAYLHITIVLKRSVRRIGGEGNVGTTVHHQQEAAAGGGQAASLVRARKNIFKTLFVVFCCFAICWTPNKIIFFMFNFGWPLDFNGALYAISVALVVSNSAINPIIYAIKYRQFRRGFCIMVGRARLSDNCDVFLNTTG
ncbi:neuromedin-U receptor 2-like [Asterias rubens]|uniref:neuromedin-U receptor 2-like n=1 Tax=Asterias rubens TaxID=7604 RepID=UPI00145567A5|nr:neuromedin-U receptor 2-like [Asterias rubens]